MIPQKLGVYAGMSFTLGDVSVNITGTVYPSYHAAKMRFMERVSGAINHHYLETGEHLKMAFITEGNSCFDDIRIDNMTGNMTGKNLITVGTGTAFYHDLEIRYTGKLYSSKDTSRMENDRFCAVDYHEIVQYILDHKKWGQHLVTGSITKHVVHDHNGIVYDVESRIIAEISL